MFLYKATTPEEYQSYFYSNTGLQQQSYSSEDIPLNSWENENGNYIHTFGNLNTIQFGIGHYTLPDDISINYKYDDSYLHFGLVYQGVTHAIVDNIEQMKNTADTFLAIDYKPTGINYWKKGQAFKGTEVSIHLDYLKNTLIPILGLSKNDIDFIKYNIRHKQTEEMKHTLLRVEHYLSKKKMTTAMQMAIALDLIAQTTHPDSKRILQNYYSSNNEYVLLGKRRLLFTKEDFDKVIRAHDILSNAASNFPTVFSLSKELQLSEQKLKCGFFHLYKQTIWEYANHIRMNQAVKLLENPENSIASISKEVGYQSQAAFINMFKKWAGICPSAFRARLKIKAT